MSIWEYAATIFATVFISDGSSLKFQKTINLFKSTRITRTHHAKFVHIRRNYQEVGGLLRTLLSFLKSSIIDVGQGYSQERIQKEVKVFKFAKIDRSLSDFQNI